MDSLSRILDDFPGETDSGHPDAYACHKPASSDVRSFGLRVACSRGGDNQRAQASGSYSSY